MDKPTAPEASIRALQASDVPEDLVNAAESDSQDHSSNFQKLLVTAKIY